MERRAAERGLSRLTWPEPWPGDGLMAMRAAVIAHQLGRGRQFALDAFRVHFREGRSLNQPSVLEAGLASAGLDPTSVLDAARRQQAKTDLRGFTEDAVQRGVFGVPSILVGGKVFWGDDRLDDAARLARGQSSAGVA